MFQGVYFHEFFSASPQRQESTFNAAIGACEKASEKTCEENTSFLAGKNVKKKTCVEISVRQLLIKSSWEQGKNVKNPQVF